MCVSLNITCTGNYMHIYFIAICIEFTIGDHIPYMAKHPLEKNFSFSLNCETSLQNVTLSICNISLQKHYNEIFTANGHLPLKFVKVSSHGCFSMHGTIIQYKTIMMVEDFVRLANSQQSSEVNFIPS